MTTHLDRPTRPKSHELGRDRGVGGSMDLFWVFSSRDNLCRGRVTVAEAGVRRQVGCLGWKRQ